MKGDAVTYRLQVLLQLRVKSTGLDGNDLGGGIRVMSNGGAALGAEEAMDIVSRRAFAGPFLNGALDGELVFRDDGDEGCRWVSEVWKQGQGGGGGMRRNNAVLGLDIQVDCVNRHVQ